MNCCITGLQWGDEGKGKVVDILAENCDFVVRYSGGANAGHTVVVDKDVFALHILPSGSVRSDVGCVIANGVVVDPETLIEEIDKLEEKAITLKDRLYISENAHVVLDYHKTEDRLREQALGKNKIGTTIRGIGPCYADKVGRSYAIRMADLTNSDLRTKLNKITAYKNKLFRGLYNVEPLNLDEILDKCERFADRLKPFITDTTKLLHSVIDRGRAVLFEGAQGTLLDLDHGTFPFVTSSNASSLGMGAGSGVPARLVDKFTGVVKAYTSRVGAGPFPTEQDNETGQYLREKGNEYGTTTGRPRRCGWLDAVAVSYASKISSIDSIALMHLDTMTNLPEVKICRAYKIDGKETDFFPANVRKLTKAECIYETLPGWKQDISNAKSLEDLPPNAKRYVKTIEQITDTPISIVSVGKRREQTIFTENS